MIADSDHERSFRHLMSLRQVMTCNGENHLLAQFSHLSGELSAPMLQPAIVVRIFAPGSSVQHRPTRQINPYQLTHDTPS